MANGSQETVSYWGALELGVHAMQHGLSGGGTTGPGRLTGWWRGWRRVWVAGVRMERVS